ncbi:MAG: uncharacterized protein H6Q00_201 [Holophagaceae bacterium]|nr:uncharacterized protein [Holophagaceae bacterium]
MALFGTHHRSIFASLFLLLLIMGSLYVLRRRIRNGWMASHPLPASTEVLQEDGSYHDIFFLHHSVGEALIREGDLRQALAARGYSLWDHGYNQVGLTRPDGSRARATYEIPDLSPTQGGGGNTDPEGLALLFTQPPHPTPDNAWSRILQHPVIIFKSCFPNNAIRDDATLEQRKLLYCQIRDIVNRHYDKLFILMTTPPLHPKATAPGEARRAQSLAAWLSSDNWRKDCKNLFVFDFYSLLADPSTGMLRTDYQDNPTSDDSHPNKAANRAVAPLLADFIDRSVREYRSVRPSRKSRSL